MWPKLEIRSSILAPFLSFLRNALTRFTRLPAACTLGWNALRDEDANTPTRRLPRTAALPSRIGPLARNVFFLHAFLVQRSLSVAPLGTPVTYAFVTSWP